MIMMASWDPACDDELRIRSASAIMNSDEFFHYHLRPRGMMRVEKYETYDFQPLVKGRVPRYAKKVRNYDIDVFANRLWTQPDPRGESIDRRYLSSLSLRTPKLSRSDRTLKNI